MNPRLPGRSAVPSEGESKTFDYEDGLRKARRGLRGRESTSIIKWKTAKIISFNEVA